MLKHSDDIAKASRRIRDIAAKQTPFATSVAINETANQAKRALEVQLPRYIDRPTPFTMRAFGVKRSTKRNQQAQIFVKAIQEEYLQFAIYGGTRKPKGRAIVVPKAARLNKYGNLARGGIKRLLQKQNVFSGEINGVSGIWERGKSGRLKLLVSYADQARYRRRFPIFKIVDGVVKNNLQKNFDKALTDAMRTAK